MHISEGILAAPVLIGGAALTLGGTGLGLKMMEYDRIPQTAVLSAAFFTASLIHVPIGPGNVHLVLNGLLGLILGWTAFPAILIALALQAVLFHYGGLTALGANTLNMALPAVIGYYLFGAASRGDGRLAAAAAFLAGFSAVLLSALLTGICLYLSGDSFRQAARVLVAAHVPVMIVEGLLTAAVVGFLKKVRPEVLYVSAVK